MNDDTLQPDFDDELLSAYLDDELSAEDRARVEGRLAADPAARTLLEQLRGASSAVRTLPAEGLGNDLSETILARAEQAMLSSRRAYPRIAEEPETPGGGAPLADGSLPPFSFGRTRRGWFWAGLAVAAALLVAFVQPEEEGERVAVRSERHRDQVRLGDVEMRAIDPAAPADQPLATGAPPSVATSGNVDPTDSPVPAEPNGDHVAGAPLLRGMSPAGPTPAAAPASAPIAESRAILSGAETRMDADSSDQLATNDRAVRLGTSDSPPAAAGGGGGYGGGREDAPVAPVKEENLVVVHVNTTPAAFKNKSFDQVLISNGIAMEEARSERQEDVRFAQPRAQADTATTDELAAATASESEVEVVLVEAPPEQITACLNTLNSDAANYLAVEVKEPPTNSSERMKKQAIDLNWSQYSRGAVPEQQKTRFALGHDWYYYSAPSDRLETIRRKGGQVAAENDVDAGEVVGRGVEKLSRARRVQSLNRNQYRSAQPLAGGAPVRDLKASDKSVVDADLAYGMQRETEELAETDDQLQVLFVISPEAAPASSPPAASPPQ